VRHLVLFPQHAKAVVKAGAIPLLNKLTESKVRETRLHAQGALLSLGGSADALEIMQKCEVRAQSESPPTVRCRRIRILSVLSVSYSLRSVNTSCEQRTVDGFAHTHKP